jgi:hypothetical protein
MPCYEFDAIVANASAKDRFLVGQVIIPHFVHFAYFLMLPKALSEKAYFTAANHDSLYFSFVAAFFKFCTFVVFVKYFF